MHRTKRRGRAHHHICVEQVTLRDMNPLLQDLVDEREDPSHDGSLATLAEIHERALGLLILENDAVQLCAQGEKKSTLPKLCPFSPGT